MTKAGPRERAQRAAREAAATTNGTAVVPVQLVMPGKLSPVGCVLPPDLSFEEWEAGFRGLSQVESGLQWWVGDWLNYGEQAYGEKYAQAVEANRATGINIESVRVAQWVAERIPLVLRRTTLPWSFHKTVAALEPDERAILLDKTEQNGWSVSALSAAVRTYKRELKLTAQEPTEVEPDSAILHGDCRYVEWPTDVDLIIADPPFGLSQNGASGVREGKGEWDELNYDELHDFNGVWLRLAVESLRDGGSLMVFGTVHNIWSIGQHLKAAGLYIVRDIVWEKPFTQSAPNINALVPSHELIIWARKGEKHTCNLTEITRDVWRDIAPQQAHAHPTEKPEKLITRLIEMASNPGDLVADPFLGSGTSAAVAKQLRRRYWGVEQDEYWWKVASERTRAA